MNVKFGAPAVLSTIPLLSVPHKRSGQSRPALSGLPGHHPAVPGSRGVPQQVVADNVVELLRGMVGGDPLLEAVAEVVGVSSADRKSGCSRALRRNCGSRARRPVEAGGLL